MVNSDWFLDLLCVFLFSHRWRFILLADYREIYEPVLVENPFAEVTEGGIGIRQVQLGLTATKIIFGIDDFKKDTFKNCCLLSKTSSFEVDPEIECFELTAVLPLEILNVTFFKKNSRMIMNMKIAGEKNVFFEFGGHLSQNLFWDTWRERIATLKQIGPNLFNLTGSSPFSSSDVIADEEEVTATIHSVPKRKHSQSSDSESKSARLPDKSVTNLTKKFSAKYTNIIEKSSNSYLSDSEHRHQMELQQYHQALSITKSHSCGYNTSW